MAKVIKQEGEEKYVQDIFLNNIEWESIKTIQPYGKFSVSEFGRFYDKSGEIKLSYFISRVEGKKENFIRLVPTYNGKEELQEIKRILNDAEIEIEFTEGKCSSCKKEKIFPTTCGLCQQEFCPECIELDDWNDETYVCHDCINDV